MYLQSGWGDGDQAGGAGSVSEAQAGTARGVLGDNSGLGWTGLGAGLGWGWGPGWVGFCCPHKKHHSQLPNKPYLSRPRGGGGGSPGPESIHTYKVVTCFPKP